MRVHRSALRHGITVEDIDHAWEMAVGAADIDPTHDPPKRLCVGPDRAGNLLELVYLEPVSEVFWEDPTVIHAMRLRPSFARYLRRRRP